MTRVCIRLFFFFFDLQKIYKIPFELKSHFFILILITVGFPAQEQVSSACL